MYWTMFLNIFLHIEWRINCSSCTIHMHIQLQNPHCLVMVDNCYGEFTEIIEPPMVVCSILYWFHLHHRVSRSKAYCTDVGCWQGADLIAGSFIKNPGGTIAPCGGYVAGRTKWVAAAAARLSAPGLGIDCGSTPGDIMRIFFQGLFLAPQMVGEAIKVNHFYPPSPCGIVLQLYPIMTF